MTRGRSESSAPPAPAGGACPGPPPCRRAAAAGGPDRVRRDSFRVSCSAIDEIAVERELANERIDLAQRERHRRPAFEIAPDEAIGGHAVIERGLGSIFDDRRPMLLRQGEDAEDAADAGRALVLMDVIADGADRSAG